MILASKQLVRDGRDEYDGIAPRPLARGALQVAVEIIPPTIEQKRRINKRKYAMIQLRPGDWLQPSNDGKTLWRMVRTEDEGWDLFSRPMPPNGLATREELLDWTSYTYETGWFGTRRVAAKYALEVEPREQA